MIRTMLAALSLFLGAATALAQGSTPWEQRAEDVAALINGSGKEADVFAPSFLAAVPMAQIKAIEAQLVAQYGELAGVARRVPKSPIEGQVEYRFAKAIVVMTLVIEPAAPHRVTGLLVTGTRVEGDSLAAIDAEFSALPGSAGYQLIVADGAATQVNGVNADRLYATGSTFKLYLLAELDRQVRAGQRKWSDVALLGPKSFSSATTNNWPDNAPMTLHSLATAMISVSDNSASDTLTRVLGQDAIAAIVRTSGHSSPAAMLPMLYTTQAFALKMPTNDDLRAKYLAGDDRAQQALLDAHTDRLGLDDVQLTGLAGGPLHIDTIEWFATPADINRLWAYLDREASTEAKAILAVNPGIASGDAARWDYIGYKGGSEPGVISLNFLGKSKRSKTVRLAASWNNAAALVDESRFLALVTRLLDLASH